jgi:hypothetical protein
LLAPKEKRGRTDGEKETNMADEKFRPTTFELFFAASRAL